MPPETCPNCGADIPPNAKACPECGSDEQTGWSDEARTDDLGLPDDSFDYDEFTKREFEGKDPAARKLHWLWWVAAVGVVVAFLLFLLR